ncbi:single-stranded DNA-binding protein [Savagea faecisuis]|uniref:Single-stranded DNA-binding protein n=1 Tax=Savagea faecisuis TaxID=1274803 RepID=A0ABW3GZV1_9BACL
MNTQDLIKKALKEVDQLEKGETFFLSDLFKGYEWKRIDRAQRLQLGRDFLEYVRKENISVKDNSKSTSNKQKYIKV